MTKVADALGLKVMFVPKVTDVSLE